MVLRDDVDLARLVVDCSVDYLLKVTSCRMKVSGEFPFTSIYRDGVGCTGLDGTTEDILRAQNLGDQTPRALNASVPWPLGDLVDIYHPPEVDMDEVQAIVDKDFRNLIFNTRAVMIVYKGQVVLEQYRDGVTKTNRLLGWSMTKSLTSTIIGMLVEQNLLDLDGLAPVAEWADPADPRHNITLESLLHMSSGLQWSEGFDVAQCLYSSDGDCAHYAASKPLRDPVYSVWEYSTGTTSLLARIAMENRDMRHLTNFEYYREKLFRRISIENAVIEHHPTTNPLGGSNAYMPLRDWARFGYLYLNDGIWDGQRVLPEGWVDYVSTRAPTRDSYGAQFWVRNDPTEDMFHASGFRNQDVFIMRSKDLVVVRNAMPDLAFSATYVFFFFLFLFLSF